MTLLPIAIDRTAPTPPWTQLRDAVVRSATAGDLEAGERLPTVRALAVALDLAPGTVARAYRELETEGWLVGQGRAGTFVADVLPTDRATQLHRAADAYLRRARSLGFDDAAARKALTARATAATAPPG